MCIRHNFCVDPISLIMRSAIRFRLLLHNATHSNPVYHDSLQSLAHSVAAKLDLPGFVASNVNCGLYNKYPVLNTKDEYRSRTLTLKF